MKFSIQGSNMYSLNGHYEIMEDKYIFRQNENRFASWFCHSNIKQTIEYLCANQELTGDISVGGLGFSLNITNIKDILKHLGLLEFVETTFVIKPCDDTLSKLEILRRNEMDFFFRLENEFLQYGKTYKITVQEVS